MNTSNITEPRESSKTRHPKTKPLSDPEQRKRLRFISDTGLQNEFEFVPSQPPQLKPELVRSKKREAAMNDELVYAAGDPSDAMEVYLTDENSATRAEFAPGKEGKQEFEEDLERYLESREEGTLERVLFRYPSKSARAPDLQDPSDGSNSCAYG
jgi:hypothetical protein